MQVVPMQILRKEKLWQVIVDGSVETDHVIFAVRPITVNMSCLNQETQKNTATGYLEKKVTLLQEMTADHIFATT